MTPFRTGETLKSSTSLLVVGCILGLYLVYLRLLPRPLSGIPYNLASRKRVFGDVPNLKAAKYRRQWIWNQPQAHGSPISQLFLHPFRKPTVIISDYREVVDICSRRLHEFDRGSRNKECIGLVAPNFHMTMETGDPKFKFHRELLRDLMTPKFLEQVAAPRIYARATLLVNLWELKRLKAQGRPFKGDHDLYLATLDIICSVAFGMGDNKTALSNEIENVESITLEPSVSAHDPADFPTAESSPDIASLLEIPEMISIAQSSPFPSLSQLLALLRPKHALAWLNRIFLIRQHTIQSLKKLQETGAGDFKRESALDELLFREKVAAMKSNRKCDFFSPAIRDEILGYLLGGHDTTATVLSWWVKYMSRYQSVQRRLRIDLQIAHAARYQEGEWPTMDDITKTSIPYLDAVVEETLRYASIATLIVRKTTCDTEIFGYPIPKGTDIMLPLTGPSMTELPLPIPEDLRSWSCQKAKDRAPDWGKDVNEYKPERWLKWKKDGNGYLTEAFDPLAGPSLAFSVGPRQCFGKKQAYMQLKTLITLLLWNFEFCEMDLELDGDEMVEKVVNLPKRCYVKLDAAP